MTPTVPTLWPGGVVACLATGQSLTQSDVDKVRGRVDGVIAINNAYQLAPWADVLYAADDKWWSWHYHTGASEIARKYSITPRATRWSGVQVLRNDGDSGLCLDPTGLRTGRNSGYQAINLAVHLGATHVLLLGYDMQGTHFFGRHPDRSQTQFHLFQQYWPSIVAPLEQAKVTVMNCTRKTALTCFPQMALEDALGRLSRAA